MKKHVFKERDTNTAISKEWHKTDQSHLWLLNQIWASYHIDVLINQWPRQSGSQVGRAELQTEPSADFRPADDKQRKQTVGTSPLMLIELGAIYRLSETTLWHTGATVHSLLYIQRENT